MTRHPALGLKSNGPSRATQSILGELKMTLYSPTDVRTGSYQLKRPIKPARALTGSPSIMLPNGPECLNCECVRLRQQVEKKIGLERHSQRKSVVIEMAAHDLRGLISGIPNASNYLLGEAHGLPEDHLPLWGGFAASSKFIRRTRITAAEQRTVFKAFRRSKPASKTSGTGLGGSKTLEDPGAGSWPWNPDYVFRCCLYCRRHYRHPRHRAGPQVASRHVSPSGADKIELRLRQRGG
jgi:hypothetical protein